VRRAHTVHYRQDSESSKQQQLQLRQQQPPAPVVVSRRGLGAAALAAGVAAAGLDLANPQPAAAVMGMTAGRVPGKGRDGIHASTLTTPTVTRTHTAPAPPKRAEATHPQVTLIESRHKTSIQGTRFRRPAPPPAPALTLPRGLAAADANGIRRYTRPEGKSGGHGVGWTEITPYSFDVYEGWTEVPVSIADPAGLLTPFHHLAALRQCTLDLYVSSDNSCHAMAGVTNHASILDTKKGVVVHAPPL